MTTRTLLSHVSAILAAHDHRQGGMLHTESGIHLLRQEVPTGLDAMVYRPLLCLVLQGAKEVGSGATTVRIRAGQSLIVSHDLPVVSRITEASPAHPYIALVFPLDLDLLRSLAPSIPPGAGRNASSGFSICLCDTDEGMADALLRLLRQCGAEDTRRLLAPITAREIHARLLIGRHAEVLQRLLWHESTGSRIYQATREIRANLSETIVVGDLARRIGMSPSAFFERFKAVTGTTPLQYQKDLRLLKARDELRTTGTKVSEIAFGVGYGSSAQFSREYARKFGKPPRQERAGTIAR